MKCPNCGKVNQRHAKYCEFCGSFLNKKVQKFVSISKKNKIILLSIFLLLVVSVSISFLFLSKSVDGKEYQKAVISADKYFEKLNYKQAEIEYLKIIEIAPKKCHAYDQLTDIYIQQNDYDKAKIILNKAKENMVDKKDIRNVSSKLNLATYVQNSLLPSEGMVKEGISEIGYLEIDGTRMVDSVHDQKGIITSRLKDFDNDGKDELFVISLTNDEVDSFGIKRNYLVFRMYEESDDKVKKSAEYIIQRGVMGESSREQDGVFLKEHKGVTYICATVHGTTYFENNIDFQSTVILTYQNDFQIFESAEESESSWDSPETKKKAGEFAKKMKSIGLNKEAEFVTSTYQRRFTFVDDVDILLRISSNKLSRGVYHYEGEYTPFDELENIQVQIKNKNFRVKVDNKTIYQDILKQYHEYEIRGFKQGNSTINLNDWLDIDNSLGNGPTMYYSYYDVNKDGIDELFIGRKYNNEIDVCDFWIYDSMSAIQPFDNSTLTYKNHIYICKNNLLETTHYGNGGHSYQFFEKIDSSGNIILVNETYAGFRLDEETGLENSEGKMKYTINDEEVNNDELTEFLNQFERIEYDWKELTEATYAF